MLVLPLLFSKYLLMTTVGDLILSCLVLPRFNVLSYGHPQAGRISGRAGLYCQRNASLGCRIWHRSYKSHQGSNIFAGKAWRGGPGKLREVDHLIAKGNTVVSGVVEQMSLTLPGSTGRTDGKTGTSNRA